MPRIAISYRREDSAAIAGRIFDRLKDRYGTDAVFRDIDAHIPAGRDFREYINKMLDQTDITLVVVGPRWFGPEKDGRRRIDNPRDPVRVEVETALRSGKPVVPVLVDGAVMPDADQLPESLRDLVWRNGLQVDSGSNFDQHVDRLIRSMEPIFADAAQSAQEQRQQTEAEAARRAEEQQRQAEAARRAEEKGRQAEALRAEEKGRQAEALRAEEERRQAKSEAAQRAEEERRQAEGARRAEEERRQAEAARRAEGAPRPARWWWRRWIGAARLAEDEKQRAEAARLAEEEKQRAEEATEVDLSNLLEMLLASVPSKFRQPDVEPVDAAVFCSPRVNAGTLLLVQVYLYEPSAAAEATIQAREADAEAVRRGTYSFPLDIPWGTRVDVRLEMDDLEIPEPDAVLVWRGRTTKTQFEVGVPATKLGDTIGRVRFAVSGIPAGTLRFKVEVVAQDARGARPIIREASAVRYHRAFASYSSQDRGEVLRRVQAFRIAGLSVFQDILELDPGERWERALYREIDFCDVFLLFWSRAAAASEWVAKEIDYALNRKGGDEERPPAIQPVPIEGPPPVPPPAALRHLHFNDALLAHIKAKASPHHTT
jgi:multidrug efflux pump subunit AcrA (membrane-fusion protein)